jgi:hypothetical protein
MSSFIAKSLLLGCSLLTLQQKIEGKNKILSNHLLLLTKFCQKENFQIFNFKKKSDFGFYFFNP